ncbi:MAG TPA: DUF5343 domain-containing protein [Patescibacteria group bacterium]|nr:DUF5343 domain-containing protein [Patescibacteria group bacterium]
MAMNPPADRQRPYAAAANVIAVLRRVRARNLPDRIDNDFLRVAGVPENVFGRVTNALRFLGLIGPDDRPTDLLRSISSAPEQEYRDLLSGVLHEAYREDFARINPADDTQAQIVDSFTPYQPRSQTSRMVMLFLGLCREAGIPVSEAPRERAMRNGPVRSRGRTTVTRTASDSVRTRDGGAASRNPATAPGGLAGLTEADLARLDQATFTELWQALGKAFYQARVVNMPAEAAPAEDDNGG